MSILVTGGAGYIGSVTVELLQEQGFEVVVLDDVYRGHQGAIAPGTPFYQGKVGDAALVERIVREHKVEASVHFAALTYVGESVAEPARYFENNTAQSTAYFTALANAGVKRVVFSSTAATYGEPKEVPMPETHPQWPLNPYGWSKFFTERVLESYDRAYGMKFVALRYFNAAGATEAHGEDHEPETHLIPNVLYAATGRLPHVMVFGSDYPTPDGTAIRDYIHVADLGSAHILALKHLEGGGQSECINLGNGTGYSVLEVIETARKVTGRKIEAKMAERRAGDPPRLVAQSEKARRVLGWKPRFPELEAIVRTSWNWHEAHPAGYGG